MSADAQQSALLRMKGRFAINKHLRRSFTRNKLRVSIRSPLGKLVGRNNLV